MEWNRIEDAISSCFWTVKGISFGMPDKRRGFGRRYISSFITDFTSFINVIPSVCHSG
jgi:hypothetical protein